VQESNLYAVHSQKAAGTEPIPEISRQTKKKTEEFTKQKAFNVLAIDVDDREHELRRHYYCGESSSILSLHLHKESSPKSSTQPRFA
jgi:hypothetical protein